MDFWMLLLIASLGAFFGNLFFNPSFQGFIKKLWKRTHNLRHPIGSKRERREMESARNIALFLALISPLPYNPGELTAQSIIDFLFNMKKISKRIKTKKLRGLKKEMVSFSEKATGIRADMELEEIRDILDRDESSRLVDNVLKIVNRYEREP